jgi:hypothetical protein
MSHNIVLVDGLGQAQPAHTRWENYSKPELYKPWFARIARFAERKGTTYFKGEAAKTYIQYPYIYREFWGRLGDEQVDPYGESDLSYLKLADRHVLFIDGRYFVMLDDIAVDKARKPAGSRFSWLFHVLEDVPLKWNNDDMAFSYKLGEVTTMVKVITNHESRFEDRIGEQGLINPITGEDYNPWVKPVQLFDRNFTGQYPEKVTHNIWITNSIPDTEMRFLTVIYPYISSSSQHIQAPVIEALDNLTVRITADGETKTITFDPAGHPDADIQVEL